MKVIFLDIDGVLNSIQYQRSRDEFDGEIDASRLPLLKALADTFDAEIVLSSSWRYNWHPNRLLCDELCRELHEKLDEYGLFIFDVTPDIDFSDRAREIRAWLDGHDDIEAFVIFDDIADGWGTLADHLVLTNERDGRGLEEEHIERAKEILNQKRL